MPKSSDPILGGIDLIRCISQSDMVLFESLVDLLQHSFISGRTLPIFVPALLVDLHVLGVPTVVLPAIHVGLTSLPLEIIVFGRMEKPFKANPEVSNDCDGNAWLAWPVDIDCMSIAGVLEFRR